MNTEHVPLPRASRSTAVALLAQRCGDDEPTATTRRTDRTAAPAATTPAPTITQRGGAGNVRRCAPPSKIVSL